MFVSPLLWLSEHWPKADFYVTKILETFLEGHAIVESKI